MHLFLEYLVLVINSIINIFEKFEIFEIKAKVFKYYFKNYFMVTRKKTKSTKKGIKKTAPNKSYATGQDLLKKDVILGGFFTIAVGLIWLFSSMGYFNISGFEIAGPFIIIVIGFLIAIGGAKE